MQLIRDWFRRHFDNPQVIGLAVVLLAGLAGIIFLGNILAPVLASLVVAYLLEGIVRKLEYWGLPRLLAVTLVFVLFFAGLLLVFFALIPVLVNQITQLVDELPKILSTSQSLLMQLPSQYPQLFSEQQISDMIFAIRREALDWGQRVLTQFSFQSVVVVITMLVYLVLLPFLVFFFLKDKRALVNWVTQYLPRDRDLLATVWHDVDAQIGNYVRGKFLEILIVWAVTYITFSLLGLSFAMLLSLTVGLSVIIPYIGAAVVTVPVGLIAYFQFGFGPEFAWVMIAYAIIQALDGNVLVPILFSEVVNLHPVAIIVAILFFGGVWGFWGIFFAIPLATVIQAILKAWPSTDAGGDASAGDSGAAALGHEDQQPGLEQR
ncbi:AI-2E family transporter [Aquisalimonas sp. 2447]|uniref:AI-2E family transporter n=1 Tax=Aquisalimonas sp. 2447 TaxID=2740807 RepID=UPI0014323228|nr:AI-2E family transporter [Aquisalimonas sp. 2447]QIT54162.1 AI-2E family transporter [Aquisalimonas sp. 2447]